MSASEWIEEWIGGVLVRSGPEIAQAPDAGPQECTPAQGLVALYVLQQITEARLDAAVAQIADPAQRYTAQVGLKRTTSWRRHSPTTQHLAQLLDLSEAELDALFTYAIGVEL